jgi:chitinase
LAFRDWWAKLFGSSNSIARNRRPCGQGLCVEGLESRTLLAVVTVSAIADAYVRGGTNAARNYGNATVLTVRNDARDSNDYESYLRFDLTGVSGAIESAVLKMTPKSVGSGAAAGTLRARLLADSSDGWVEGNGGTDNNPVGEICWNNRPVGVGAQATLTDTYSANVAKSINVTSLVNQAGNANGFASFHLDFTAAGFNRYVHFHSRQASTVRYRPVLELTTAAAANRSPVAAADSATAAKNAFIDIPVLANDSDPDGDALSISGVSQGAHGSVAVQSGGTVRYTPAADYLGADSFSYTISDGRGGSATATVSITVAEGAGKRIIGYFTSWGIYGRNFQVADIPADKLTHVNYAFANVSAAGEVVMGDAYADGINFPRLRQLKVQHPGLKTLISVGGWTWSERFSDAALTAASRQKFATSAVNFIQQHGFDGVDVDWEFPVGGGEADNVNRPEDKQNYTLLMQELRRQFDALELQNGRDYYLSIAAPSGAALTANIEIAALGQTLDWINLMAYDFHGSWSARTGFNAPLYAAPGDPDDARLNTDWAVSHYLTSGVPADKLIVGAPFYGRGWSGVPNVNGGLYQTFTGLPQGTWEAGMFDYRDLVNRQLAAGSGYTRRWNDAAKVPWLYNPTTGIMISYDDPESMGNKADYVKTRNLGGMMFWELSGDDAQDSLLVAVHSRLNGATP